MKNFIWFADKIVATANVESVFLEQMEDEFSLYMQMNNEERSLLSEDFPFTDEDRDKVALKVNDRMMGLFKQLNG